MTAISTGSGPDEDALRQAYDDLMSLWDAQEHVRVGRQKARRLFLMHGLIAHTVAQAQAASTLLKDPQTAACAEVNARVAFEHAVTAQYVYLCPNGLEEFEQLIRYREFKFQRAVMRLPNITLPDDMERISAAAKPKMDNFFWLCERFDESGWLYLPYRVLCTSTHPSNGTLSRYLEQGEGDLPQLRTYGVADDERSTLWAIVFSALMVVAVLEDLRRFKPNKARVRRIASSIRAPSFLTLRT